MVKDPRKGVRKLHGSFITWDGKPSTKEAYDAQFQTGVEEPEVYEDSGVDMLNTAVLETDIPYKQNLHDAGYVYIKDIPRSSEMLLSVSGIGPAGLEKLDKWVHDYFGYPLIEEE